MPFSISRLRRWFVIGAVLIVLVVVGAYLYARLRVRNALKEVPNRIGINIQQTASGFTVSRSEQGRTIFKAQASKAIQFRQGGITELHDVAITLYGRDASRFDQIYGSDFEYNPATGDISAKGEVQIDIEANQLFHPVRHVGEAPHEFRCGRRRAVVQPVNGDAIYNGAVDNAPSMITYSVVAHGQYGSARAWNETAGGWPTGAFGFGNGRA